MTTGFHPPVEEYLEAMFELEEAGVAVIRARLAERLGHAAPTVSEMVRRLEGDGYVQTKGRTLKMTASGRNVAESVVRKHRLAERLLADVIGLEWHKVHAEAGRWEHVISDDVEERLVILLENPSTCPHGNPIPGTTPPKRKLRPLGDVAAGERVRLERITETVELALSRDALGVVEIAHDYNYAQVLTLDLLGKGFGYAEVPITYGRRIHGRSFVTVGRYLRKVLPAMARTARTR